MADNNASDASSPAAPPQANPQDLNAFVETLLSSMQVKFEEMSKQILTKIDDMSTRVDELEKSIGGLMDQSALEQPESGSK